MDEAELRLNERLRPLRVEEYEALARAGAFRDQKVELLRGRVVWMAPQGEEHAFAIELLTRVLVKAFDGLAAVRPQLPFRAGDDSMPEPRGPELSPDERSRDRSIPTRFVGLPAPHRASASRSPASRVGRLGRDLRSPV